MTPSTATALCTFEDYLAYDDGSENRYELVDGELVAMSPPVMEHFLIAKFLEQALDIEIRRLQRPWLCFRESGVRTGLRKSRLTDVSVVTLDQAQELKGRSVVFSTSPLLVIEVVSPDSVTRDYRYKRTEYAALEIPEYWVVDPLESKVTVLVFNEGLYDETVFVGDQVLVSPTFPELALTVDQILAAGELPRAQD
ncbi:Uma2 family endonuclease [Nodosilinea sp. LEGE 06152]|uniref:Uma2 family endonuclease n=1 Tax=Nodosilinea sp. LEGE 06152 TaxID=2777966 RepID=UPI00187FE6B7|nr:Uma2 family endonuclease [Nodosilinea sp. LEGE 06152]MBE9155485.1 Uma2 family endonuclease [Nodosilinea sp. LEGE 06152]